MQSPAGFSCTNGCTLCLPLQFALQHGAGGEVRQPHSSTTAMTNKRGRPSEPHGRIRMVALSRSRIAAPGHATLALLSLTPTPGTADSTAVQQVWVITDLENTSCLGAPQRYPCRQLPSSSIAAEQWRGMARSAVLPAAVCPHPQLYAPQGALVAASKVHRQPHIASCFG